MENLSSHILDGTKSKFKKKVKYLKTSKINLMYFVHSYEFIPEDKSVISSTTDYSSKIVCSVERDNLFGAVSPREK